MNRGTDEGRRPTLEMAGVDQLTDRTSDPAPGMTDRDELRELAAGIVAATIAMTVWAAAIVPDTFERIDFSDVVDVVQAASFWAAGLLVSLASLAGGAVSWIVFAERRRPWPFGPRRRPLGIRWAPAAAVAVMMLVTKPARDSWPWTVVLPTNDPSTAFVVHLPENLSRGLVLGLAAAGILWVLVALVADLVGRHRTNAVRVPRANGP